MKYDVTVTGLGPMALEFLDPSMEMPFIILFNESAPAELAELAVLHTEAELTEAPAAGDTPAGAAAADREERDALWLLPPISVEI